MHELNVPFSMTSARERVLINHCLFNAQARADVGEYVYKGEVVRYEKHNYIYCYSCHSDYDRIYIYLIDKYAYNAKFVGIIKH